MPKSIYVYWEIRVLIRSSKSETHKPNKWAPQKILEKVQTKGSTKVNERHELSQTHLYN